MMDSEFIKLYDGSYIRSEMFYLFDIQQDDPSIGGKYVVRGTIHSEEENMDFVHDISKHESHEEAQKYIDKLMVKLFGEDILGVL